MFDFGLGLCFDFHLKEVFEGYESFSLLEEEQ